MSSLPADDPAAAQAAPHPDDALVGGWFRNLLRDVGKFHGARAPETDPAARAVVRGLVEEFAPLSAAKVRAALPQADKLRVQLYRASFPHMRSRDVQLRVQFNRSLVRRVVGGQDVRVRAYYVQPKRSGRAFALDDFFDKDSRPVSFQLSGVAGALADTKQRLDEVARLVPAAGDDAQLTEGTRAYVHEMDLDGGRTQFVALVFGDAAPQPLAWVLVGTRPTAVPVAGPVAAPAAAAVGEGYDDDDGEGNAPGRVRRAVLVLFDSRDRNQIYLFRGRNARAWSLPTAEVARGQRPWKALAKQYRAYQRGWLRAREGDRVRLPPMAGLHGGPKASVQHYDLMDGTTRVYVAALRTMEGPEEHPGAKWMPWKDGYGAAEADMWVRSGMLPRVSAMTRAVWDALAMRGAYREDADAGAVGHDYHHYYRHRRMGGAAYDDDDDSAASSSSEESCTASSSSSSSSSMASSVSVDDMGSSCSEEQEEDEMDAAKPSHVALLMFDDAGRAKVYLVRHYAPGTAAHGQWRLVGGQVRAGERPWDALERHFADANGWMPVGQRGRGFRRGGWGRRRGWGGWGRGWRGRRWGGLPWLWALGGAAAALPFFALLGGKLRMYVGHTDGAHADVPAHEGAGWRNWNDGAAPVALTPATEQLLEEAARAPGALAPTEPAEIEGRIAGPRIQVHTLQPLAALGMAAKERAVREDGAAVRDLALRDVTQVTPRETRTLIGKDANIAVLDYEIFGRTRLRIAQAEQEGMVSALQALDADLRISPSAMAYMDFAERGKILGRGARPRTGARRIVVLDTGATAPSLSNWFDSRGRARLVRLRLRLPDLKRVHVDAYVRIGATAKELYTSIAPALNRTNPVLMAAPLRAGALRDLRKNERAYAVLEFVPRDGVNAAEAAKYPDSALVLARVHLYRVREY